MMKGDLRAGLYEPFLRRAVSVAILLIAGLCSSVSYSDGGVLIPYDRGVQIDSSNLDLADMEVRVEIDNGMAQVAVMQIYRSHLDRQLEGEYQFLIPDEGELSGFAIWEDGVRIPGVILERWRAKEVYESFKARLIDPGLMESAEEHEVNRFACRVFPIPPYGTKRIELFYTQNLPVESDSLHFLFPSRPTSYQAQTAGRFKFTLKFQSQAPFGNPVFEGEALVPRILNPTADGFEAVLEEERTALTENIVLNVPMPVDPSKVWILSYRDVERVWRDVSPSGGKNYKDEYGYFGARILFGRGESGERAAPKQVVLALDTSLSMQWDKLQRALEVAFHLVSGLKEGDQFGLLTFNAAVTPMNRSVAPWSPASAEQAEQWIRSASLAGGTDFSGLFDAVHKQYSGGERKQLVLITDGSPTLSQLSIQKLSQDFAASDLAKAKARLFVVGIGDDANRTFLSDLAKMGHGPYVHLLPTEDSGHKAKVLLDRLDSEAIEDVHVVLTGPSVLDIHPKDPGVAFGGGSMDFVGRFDRPGKGSAVVKYKVGGKEKSLRTDVVFAEKDNEHEGLRRRWARARVDELLDRINREGEKEEWIREIIDLSRQFTFVTPYTSFLAAPRALLRPRVIRPGDPLLRVKTDPSIRSVVAGFPFGLTEKMRYLSDEDIWQLRFLAPPGWSDGKYSCNLYLTDVEGRRYVEKKEFIIDGRPPRIYPKIEKPLQAGTTEVLTAAADRDTRRLSARVPMAGYCRLNYDPEKKMCVGTIELPKGMPPGETRVQWFAEDFAHNVTHVESVVEVIGYE